jgi:outer membrane protein TolC
MKSIVAQFLLLALCTTMLNGQVTLDQILQKVQAYAPEASLHIIAEQKEMLQVSNINKQLLPQFAITGQSTYQSDVTFLDVNLPNIEIDRPSEFQYKLQMEVGQIIYDGGVLSMQKKVAEVEHQITKWQAEMVIEQLRLQAIQIYFSLLELKEQFTLLDSRREDLKAQVERMEISLENEIVLESDLNEFQAALISLDQNYIDLEIQENIFLHLLYRLTGVEYTNEDEFELPISLTSVENADIDRAYYRILEWQGTAIENNYANKKAMLKPKISGFGQLGVGRPGLNFLDNSFTDYYVLGLRFRMDLGNLYTRKGDRQISILEKEELDLKKKSFDRDLYSTISEYEENIIRFSKKVENDQKLLELKENIYNTAQAQFDNGAMNSSDFLMKWNEKNRVLQSVALGNLRKQKYEHLLKYVRGNY